MSLQIAGLLCGVGSACLAIGWASARRRERRLRALLERAWPMVDDITNHWEGDAIATPEGAAKKLSTDILEVFPGHEWP